MKNAKKTITDYLSKIKPIHFIFTLVVGLGLIILLVSQLLSHFAATNNAFWVVFMLSIFFLLSRLSILVKVGIGFLPFIMFPIMIVFGPLVNLAMILATTAVYCWIAVRPTPFDFLITKGFASSIAQMIYLSIWTFAMIPFLKIISLSYIQAHLTFVYMLSVLIYIIFMVICLPLLAREPIPMALINGMLMLPIQWLLITFFGARFLEYMLTFM